MNKVNEPAKVPVYIPFLHHPDCYLDILYLHLKVNEEKVRCQEIYNVLCNLARCPHPNGESGQVSNFSPYIFETHSSTIKLATHMAALLAHPVQREEVCTYSHSYFWKRLSYYLSFIDRISSDIHDILYLYFASVAIYLMPYLMSRNLIRALRLITYFTYHLRLLFSHTFPKIPSSLLYIHILKCVVQHFFL